MNKARMTFRLDDSGMRPLQNDKPSSDTPAMVEVKPDGGRAPELISLGRESKPNGLEDAGWSDFQEDYGNPFQNHSSPFGVNHQDFEADSDEFDKRHDRNYADWNGRRPQESHGPDGPHGPLYAEEPEADKHHSPEHYASVPYSSERYGTDRYAPDPYSPGRYNADHELSGPYGSDPYLPRYSGGSERDQLDHIGPIWTDEPVRRRPPSKGSGWKVLGSVTGAIVTGALFGLVVLSLFNRDVDFPIPGLTNARESALRAVESLPVMGNAGSAANSQTGTQSDPEALLPSVEVSVPEQSYYFLQYGVFSTEEGVDRATQELKASGLAAAKDIVNDKRVYTAISGDREQAKLLSSQLKAEGVNLILHEADISKDAVVHFGKPGNVLEEYANQSAGLVKLLCETSASLLLEDSPAISPDVLSSLKEQHVQFTQNAAAVRDGFAGESGRLAQEMETEMNTAVEALQQFDKTKAKSHLWEVQNAMMQYVLDEQQLFKAE